MSNRATRINDTRRECSIAADPLKPLVDQQRRLQALYFTLKDARPEVAALIREAGVKLAEAIGALSPGKTVVEVVS